MHISFDMFPRSDFCGHFLILPLTVESPKSLIISHSFTLHRSTRDINNTVSTYTVCRITILCTSLLSSSFIKKGSGYPDWVRKTGTWIDIIPHLPGDH